MSKYATVIMYISVLLTYLSNNRISCKCFVVVGRSASNTGAIIISVRDTTTTATIATSMNIR